jgi:hypothetical protein
MLQRPTSQGASAPVDDECIDGRLPELEKALDRDLVVV